MLPEVDSFVVSELPAGHVAVVPDDLTNVLRGQFHLISIDKTKLPLLAVSLHLKLMPFSRCKQNFRKTVKLATIITRRLLFYDCTHIFREVSPQIFV